MKKTKLNHIALILVFIFSTSFGFSQDTFTDERDGQTYKTVKIGDQVWLAENLNFKTENSWCYDDNPEHCEIYGRLYTWYAAVDTNTCPAGWHLPTNDEWKTLEMELGMSQSEADTIDRRGTDEGGKLKEESVCTSHWKSPNKGATNSSGFTALPGGIRDYSDGAFYDLGTDADFWTATESDASNAWNRNLYYDYAEVDRYYFSKSDGFSVRCVKD